MSKQVTLDQFITIKNKRRTIFYVDWTLENPKGQWLIDRPSKINYEATVKWRDMGYYITICGYNEEKEYPLPLEEDYKNVSLLKSHLQKCVRRQLNGKAVATAWHLMKMDFNSLLRRLPIIMIEDVSLRDSFSTLMWLVCAISKDYKITKKQIIWILDLVDSMCSDIIYDRSDTLYPKEQIETDCSKWYKLIEKNDMLTREKKDLLISVLLRVSYGGMKGDMRLLYNFVGYGYMKDRIQSYPIKETRIDIENIKDLQLSEIEHASIDFHCFPSILNQLQSEYKQYTEDEIKRAIWECNSKYNKRDIFEVDDHWREIWEKIKQSMENLQKEYISKKH